MLPTAYRACTTPQQRRYAGFLLQCDPPADALAQALETGRLSHDAVTAALEGGAARDPALGDFLDALAPPLWVDPARERLGCEALQRTGVLGGLVLALYCLPLGYLSEAAVKPLALSGRLVEQAPRRLSETNRFLLEVTTPGGMAPGQAGWLLVGRVRLMHAVMRRRLAPRWRPEAWGAPINQAHMAGTNLLFSLHALDGLRQLGVLFTPEEVDGTLHLWRHIGHTLGVVDELLCPTEADARQLWALGQAVEAPPDADGQALARALVGQAVPRVLVSGLALEEPPPVVGELCFRLSAALLGPERAARLGYPEAVGPLPVAPLLRALVASVERVRSHSPRSHALLLSLGQRVNRNLAEASLGGLPARFVA